jgi:hypothetical protein
MSMLGSAVFSMSDALANIKDASSAVYHSFITGFGNFITAFREVKATENQIGVVVIGAHAVLDNAATYESLKQFKDAQSALKAVVWGAKPASVQDQANLNSALEATNITKEATVMLSSMKAVLESFGPGKKVMLLLSEKDVAALEAEVGISIAELLDENKLLKVAIVKDSVNGEAAPMTLAFANLMARNLNVVAPGLRKNLERLVAMTYKDAVTPDAMGALTDLSASLVTIAPVGVNAETDSAAQTYKETTRKLESGV